MAALTFAKSFASLAFGIVENARRMSPEIYGKERAAGEGDAS